MSKVVAIMSMSLDGYVADLNDGVAEVFDWYFTSGDVEIHTGGSDPMTFKVSGPSAEHLRGLTSGLGAVLTGRRTFDVAQGWGGNHAWGPAFVLTHHVSRCYPLVRSRCACHPGGLGAPSSFALNSWFMRSLNSVGIRTSTTDFGRACHLTSA